MKTSNSFINEFIRNAEEHDICLESKNYSKRSRHNKKLIKMLEELNGIQILVSAVFIRQPLTILFAVVQI